MSFPPRPWGPAAPKARHRLELCLLNVDAVLASGATAAQLGTDPRMLLQMREQFHAFQGLLATIPLGEGLTPAELASLPLLPLPIALPPPGSDARAFQERFRDLMQALTDAWRVLVELQRASPSPGEGP